MNDKMQTDVDKTRRDSNGEQTEVKKKRHDDTVKSALRNAGSASRTHQDALDRVAPLRSLGVYDDTLASLLDRGDVLTELAKFREPIDSIASMQYDADRMLAGIGQQEAVLANAFDDMARLTRIPEDSIRLSLGPLRELESAAFSPSLQAMAEEHESFRAMAAQAAAQFRMPEFNETARLLAEIQSRSESALRGLSVHSDSIQATMDAIREPWINAENALRSVSSFTELQAMATRLTERSPYEGLVVDQLRHNLGDWRDQIVLPGDIGDDLALRSEFYVEHGFDPGLTEFPNPVFEEALEHGALREPIPEIGIVGQEDVPPPDGIEEAGLVRTNWAHDRLTRLELHIRVFIDAQMRATIGENWIRQRVPAPMREAWSEKRERAKQVGEVPKELIHYADFADYAMLMERRDNWNDVFKPVFRRKEDIRESWQRLFPIRIATMHARLISQDDELLLVVESKRILKAIGVFR